MSGDQRVDSLLVFYASQTGNAEWIAKSIDKTATDKGYRCQCLVMDDHAEVNLERVPLVVFVVSTTGDGDPPDNSLKFWRWLRRNKSANLLKSMRYAILGLGDTNYDNFCNTAKRLEKRLQEGGAAAFYATGRADDATGLEAVVDPWIEGLWPVLATVCRPASAAATATAEDASSVPVTPALPPPPPTTTPTCSVPAPSTSSTSTATTKVATECINTLVNDITNGVAEMDTQAVFVDTNLHTDLAHAYPSYVLPIDTTALEQGLVKLTHLAKSPADLCDLVPVQAELDMPHSVPAFFKAPSPLLTARIAASRVLTQPSALKRTLHFELAIVQEATADSPLIYDELDILPGDSFGIAVENDPRLVQAVLDALGETDRADQPIRIQPKVAADALPTHLTIAAEQAAVTARILLTHAIDLTGQLRKTTLRLLSNISQDLDEKKRLLFLCSKEGGSAFKKLRELQPTVLDLLLTFPHARPSLAQLLAALPALQPRSYSCTNTPLTHPRHLHFAFNVANYLDEHGRRRLGVCTPWLDRLAQQSSMTGRPIHLRVYLRPNLTGFRVPESQLRRPLLLIGPGTGVAPFVGFIAHRAEQRRLRLRQGGLSRVPTREVHAAFGPIHLYYGCRDDRVDFLYRDELSRAQQDGTLTQLTLACSRRPDHGRRYVQDGLREHAAQIWQIMSEQDGLIFVCGDATGMARDVNDTLVEIVRQHGGAADTRAAQDVLTDWTRHGRYLRDLWA